MPFRGAFIKDGPAGSGSENDWPTLGTAGSEGCLCAEGEKGLLNNGCREMLKSRNQMLDSSGQKGGITDEN